MRLSQPDDSQSRRPSHRPRARHAHGRDVARGPAASAQTNAPPTRDETVRQNRRRGPARRPSEAPVQCDQSNTNRTGTSPPSRVRVASVSGLRRGRASRAARPAVAGRRPPPRPGRTRRCTRGVSRLPRQSQSHINKSPKRPPGTSTEPHPPLDHDRPGHERAHEATPRRSIHGGWSTVLEPSLKRRRQGRMATLGRIYLRAFAPPCDFPRMVVGSEFLDVPRMDLYLPDASASPSKPHISLSGTSCLVSKTGSPFSPSIPSFSSVDRKARAGATLDACSIIRRLLYCAACAGVPGGATARSPTSVHLSSS